MAWLKLELEADQAQVERLETLFESAGASALSLSDARDQPLLEPGPGETPLWSSVRLQALFSDDHDPASLLRRADAAWREATGATLPETTVTLLQDEDWVHAWRQHAAPQQYGSTLCILPAADADASAPAANRDAPGSGARVLLPPGLAFGTGTHPTTRLCLQWLAEYPPRGRSVLDFGCGSGILALAALALGAASAVGVDHDRQALLASADNARLNGCAASLALYREIPESLACDLVVANVLAGPLIAFADRLFDALAPAGELLLTGILDDQADAVAAAYPDLAFEARRAEGWTLLVGRRR